MKDLLFTMGLKSSHLIRGRGDDPRVFAEGGGWGGRGLLSELSKFDFPHPLDVRLHASSHLDTSNNIFFLVTSSLKRICLTNATLDLRPYKHHKSKPT